MLGSRKLLGGLSEMTVELGAGRVTMAVFEALKKAGRLAEAEKLIPAGKVIRSMDELDVSRETVLSDGMVLTQFYSPDQPRAADGKWTKAGGGGSWKRWKKHPQFQKPADTLSANIKGNPEVFIDNTTEKNGGAVFVIERGNAGVAIEMRGGNFYGRSFYLKGVAPHPDSPELVKDALDGIKTAGISNSNYLSNPEMLRQANRALKEGWRDGPMPIPKPLEPSYKGSVLKENDAADHLKTRANFTPEDDGPLARYIKDSSINHQLRESGGGEHELDGVIERQGANTEGYMVYRGLAHLPEVDITGATLTDPAFTSTSMLRNVASRFTNGVIMEVTVPPGFKGAAVNLGVDKTSGLANKAMEGEAEVLFGRNTKIRILHDTTFGDRGRRLIAEMVKE
jgi:hypothetical protein